MPYKNSTYVDNAIDFERFKIYDEKFEFPQKDKIQITMFGFDYKRKGVDLAIKAMQDISDELNLHLNIVVSVDKESIQRQIIEEFSSIPKWVDILEPRNDIATYLNKTDVFISPSREEGFCYALVEAGYCKCLLISSKIPGVPYHIPNCKVFESEKFEELTTQIKETVKLYRQIDKNQTKKYIEENYHIDLWSEKIQKKLNEVLQHG